MTTEDTEKIECARWIAWRYSPSGYTRLLMKKDTKEFFTNEQVLDAWYNSPERKMLYDKEG